MCIRDSVYAAVDALPRVANGLGITIVSTPKGVMADHAAREANVGGEAVSYTHLDVYKRQLERWL